MADGVSSDTIFESIQGQLSGIQGQLGSIGREVGETRQMATEARMVGQSAAESIQELKGNVKDITVTLKGNGHTGLVRRVDILEERQRNPKASTQTLEAVVDGNEKVQLLKWDTIKGLGDKALKLLAVVVLIILGYDKMAAMLFGVPPVPEAPKQPTAVESVNPSSTASPSNKVSPVN